MTETAAALRNRLAVGDAAELERIIRAMRDTGMSADDVADTARRIADEAGR